MPQNWKTYKIGDISSEVYSGGTPSTKKEEYYGGNIPWLNTKEVDFQNIRYTEKFITELGFQKSSAKWVPKNAVIIAMYGNTAGKSAIAKIPLTTNQACCNLVINPEKADYRFVYYKILNDYKLIKDLSVGGAQQNLNAGTIKNYEIKIPSLKEQKSIASILSALDDKIELNLQMNKTLEEMAMTLFKHWFVDFGPFQDGEFVDSELGEIPKGWEIEKLEKFIEIKNGYAFKGKDFCDSGVPVLKIKNVKAGKILLDNLAYVSEVVALKASKAKIEFEDILITMTGNRLGGSPDTWVGKAALFLKEGDYYLNQRVSMLKIKNHYQMSRFYLATMFRTDDFQYYFINNSTSSGGQANISPTLIYNTPILIPPKTYLDEFHKMSSGFINQIYQNQSENEILVELRDTLLPKLISGEVRIKDVEKIVTEVL